MNLEPLESQECKLGALHAVSSRPRGRPLRRTGGQGFRAQVSECQVPAGTRAPGCRKREPRSEACPGPPAGCSRMAVGLGQQWLGSGESGCTRHPSPRCLTPCRQGDRLLGPGMCSDGAQDASVVLDAVARVLWWKETVRSPPGLELPRASWAMEGESSR